jgi:polyhydroxyalkanoate synthesis regulator phasin
MAAARGKKPIALGTSEARRSLPELVKRASARRKPAVDPESHAVRITTRGLDGSASLVPTVDLIAAKERIEELEEELENAGLALFLQDRLQRSEGKRLSAGDFLAEIGMSEFVEQLPGG